MVSKWLDESDFEKWINENPELKEQIDELKLKWLFEFDTVENRKIMNSQFGDLITSYISKKRNDKIDSIL